MEKIILTLALIVIFACGLVAQTSISLSDAIQIGLKNTYDIEIYEKREDFANRDAKRRIPSSLPQVDFRLRQTNRLNFDSSPTSFVEGVYTQSGIESRLDFSWMIFDGFRARISKERLRQLYEQSQGMTQLVVENTVHAIVLAYYNAAIEKEKTDVMQAAMGLSLDRLRNAQVLRKEGQISEFDLLNFENAHLQDSAAWRLQSLDYYRAVKEMNYLISPQKVSNFTPRNVLDGNAKRYAYDQLEAALVKSNTDLRNQYANLMLRENALRQERSYRKPRVSMAGGTSQEFNTSQFTNQERQNGAVFDFYVNFTFSYTLFDGGERRRRMDEAFVEKEIAELEMDVVKARLRNELALTLERYNESLGIIGIQDQLIRNLDRSLALSKDRVNSGYAIYLEYRSLQLTQLEARLARLEAIFNLKIIEAELIKLTGGFTQYK